MHSNEHNLMEKSFTAQHECIQEGMLGELSGAVNMLVKSTDALNETSKQQILLMRDVVSQGARLDSIEARTDKVENDVDGMYDRVREVEQFQAMRKGALEKEEEMQSEGRMIKVNVKAGLIVGIVFAAAGAFFWLLGLYDYWGKHSTSTVTNTVSTSTKSGGGK